MLDLPGVDSREFTQGNKDTVPKFSPDGRTLAFLRPDDAGKRQVWRMDAGGGEARLLTNSGPHRLGSVFSGPRLGQDSGGGDGAGHVPSQGELVPRPHDPTLRRPFVYTGTEPRVRVFRVILRFYLGCGAH